MKSHIHLSYSEITEIKMENQNSATMFDELSNEESSRIQCMSCVDAFLTSLSVIFKIR